MGKKTKAESLPVILPPKNTSALNTPRAVRREMAKVYRGVINGRIAAEDGTRLVYILKEVGAAIAAEPQNQPQGAYVHTVNIIGVPSGEFLSQEEVDRLAAQLAEPLPEAPPSKPMLRLFENQDVDDVEPESAV